MKTVQITEGTYGYRKEGSNRVRPVSIGGIVEVSDAEAERLVALKVAKYYGGDEPAEQEQSKTPGQDAVQQEKTGGANATTGGNDGADNGTDNGGADGTPANDVSPAEQLMKMKLDELKAMAADMGIDDPKLKTKPHFVNAIIKATVSNGDIV